jgi:hypothetical protein
MSKVINKVQEYEFLWRNNGLHPGSFQDSEDGTILAQEIEHVPMTDALSYPDAPYFLKLTFENFVREAIEPLAIGSNLLQRINYKAGQVLTLPSVGAMYAADIDEGMEYPERQLNFGPGVKIATIGKSGLAFKVTEEMIRYSQYDIVALHLRAAGRALIRWKEEKIWNLITRTGVTTHNNVSPTDSIFGITGGRSLSGAGNGAPLMDDIYNAYGQVMNNGFIPNAIIVHPLTWSMFATDPVLRAFALQNGGGAWFNGPVGSLNKDPWGSGIMGGLGPKGNRKINPPGSQTGTPSPFNHYNQHMQTGPNIPSYLGLPLQVIVSPYVPYDPVTRLTDIIVADINSMGVLIVDEEPVMEEIPDKYRDILKIKLRERYTVHELNQGHAVGVLRNVKVTQNEIITPVMGTASVLEALDRGSAILDSNGNVITSGDGE